MNEHVVEHGRMFNEMDDEMARNVCVIGTATRDELWGSPEKAGREIIPVGETIFINHVPFTIIGMFQHYESEQERKAREFAKAQAASSRSRAVSRDRGCGGSGRRRRQCRFLPEERNGLHSSEHHVDEVSLGLQWRPS